MENLQQSKKALSLMTYATEEQVKAIIEAHRNAIESVAYIIHDKDEAEKHVHIYMVCTRNRRLQDVVNWFKNCTDEKNESCNTFIEPIKSMTACEKYATHSDEESKQKGKHQYKEEDIKYLNGISEPWSYKTAIDVAQEATERKEAQADEVEGLLNDIINEKPSRYMARKYGRDYMKNASKYRDFASCVIMEETQDIDHARRISSHNNAFLTAIANESYENGAKSALFFIKRAIEDMRDNDKFNYNNLMEVLKNGNQ